MPQLAGPRNVCLGHMEVVGAFVLDLDLTWPQTQIDDTIRQAMDVYDGIDVLVNNAGYAGLGLVERIRSVGSSIARR